MKDIRVPLEKLFLDPQNYRLRSHPEYSPYKNLTDAMIVRESVQNRTYRLVAGTKNSEILDLIDSIKANGFLKVDNILVRKLKGDLGYVVIEGNRRTAALRAIKASMDEGYDIGKLDPNIFSQPTGDESHGVDVVEFAYKNEEEYLVLMGLRHVSGNKKWDRYNQAKLVAELFGKGYDFEKIASKIGLKNGLVAKQMLDTYFVIDEFIKNDQLYSFDKAFNPHDKYQIFEQVIGLKKVRDWLGWNEKSRKFGVKKNRERFYSWITPYFGPAENGLDEEEPENQLFQPIIVNHKNIRELADIVDDPDSLSIMEETRSLTEAMEQNQGYTRKKFISSLKAAEKTLSNIKIGPSLTLSNEETKILDNIAAIATKLKQN